MEPSYLFCRTCDYNFRNAGGVVFYESSGGNPGGFLRIEDIADDTYAVFPPAKFQGDLRAYNGGLLSYDFIVLDPKTPLSSVGSGFGRITIFGGGLNATFDYAPDPPVSSTEFWKRYNVPMTANAWKTSEENWQTILSEVSYGDFVLQAGREIGLDNFKIDAVPEPATMLLLGGGLMGILLKRRLT